MHLIRVLTITILLVAVEQSTAQLTKEQQAQCLSEMTPKYNAETDKELADKLAKNHALLKSSKDLMAGLNAQQKTKLVNTYFVGICAPIKGFYDL